MADNEYPKMLYAEDGRTAVVNSADEEMGLDGFSDQPNDAHRRLSNPGAATVHPSGDEALADMIADRVVQRLRNETAPDTLTQDSSEPSTRRGPGRPPKSSY